MAAKAMGIDTDSVKAACFVLSSLAALGGIIESTRLGEALPNQGVHALRGVDFDVYCSEIVGLVGDNSAGKSTLVNILPGTIQYDADKMYVDSVEVRFRSRKDAILHGIEIVYQDLRLVPSLTIARNIFLGREIEKRIGPIM